MSEEPKQLEVSKTTKKIGFRWPKILKNRIFIFVTSVIFFALGFFLLYSLDVENSRRPDWAFLNWFNNLFRSMGITFNVRITTWLVFFIFFIAFFVLYFVIIFFKDWKKKLDQKSIDKNARPMDKKEMTRYCVTFFGILAAILAVGIVLVVCFWPFRDTNWGNIGNEIINLFESFGILLILILVIPVAVLILILLFKLIVMIVSLFISGISNSVMQSENYQRNKAASMAAADDISDQMKQARDLADESVKLANSVANGQVKKNNKSGSALFPALTAIDRKWDNINAEKEVKKAGEEAEDAKRAELIEKGELTPNDEVEAIDPNARGPFNYEQFRVFAYEFQSYLAHNHYYFKINVLRSFIAGLASARLILLEGLSGTGKSTLPRVFEEYVGGKAYFFPVQATWRDRSDITGFYSDFTGEFKETELLKHLYEARYTENDINLMVLDEMNISRVEYYFADFLSIFEYPSEDWLVPLLQVKAGTELPRFIENGNVRIPTNTWFVGTVNIDDSTFTIADKVYDRAIVIDFDELNLPFEPTYRHDAHPLHVDELVNMFEVCKSKPENNLNQNERKKFMQLTDFISETFDIQYGNRIMNQVDNFLPVFVGLGGTKDEALDIMLARKVLRKLEGKFESYVRDGLNKLNRYINTAYGKHTLPETEKVIEKFRRKLS